MGWNGAVCVFLQSFEEVQYTPPDINWDDLGVVCVTLVKFLTNPPQKIDMSTAEGECGEDVIVGVRQKKGWGKSEILCPAMKRQREVVRKLHRQVGRFPIFQRTQLLTP
ncbi:unnamed protein product [Prunus armeniaca]